MIDVVIPTLNEHQNLAQTIRTTRDRADRAVTVLVADCGSHDGTDVIARSHAEGVSNGSGGRAEAMQRGARLGRGKIILFLHADTALPVGWDRQIESAVERGAVGGAFDFRFGADVRRSWHANPQLCIVEVLNRMRFRIGRRFYGDRASRP